jgi:hypothetical protein
MLCPANFMYKNQYLGNNSFYMHNNINDYSTQCFIYLHAYPTAQIPIIK